MTTFELAEVRAFVAGLDTQVSRCENGEGMECATLDDALRYHATLCCQFCSAVREWGKAVFSGRVAFDPEVETVWRTEASDLFVLASEMYALGVKADVPCWELEGRDALGAALWDMHRLFSRWVTPKLAVGPAARHQPALSAGEVEEARRRIDALPPLPADWQPATPKQQRQYKRSLKWRNS